MSLPKNMFRQDEDYNNIRPSSIGTREHEDNVATIVLFQEGQSEIYNTTPPDYLTSLNKTVSYLLSESVVSEVQGFPEIPGGQIPMISLDKKNGYYGIFNNFSVLSMAELHDQITKVHMNFGAKWNVFLFGNTPNMYRINGVFLDTKEYPYYQEFMVAYENFLSGRKCVENGMQLKLIISGQIIDGFLLSVNVNHNAATQMLKEFQLTMLVKGSSWIRSNLIETVGTNQTREEFNGLSNFGRMANEEIKNNALSAIQGNVGFEGVVGFQ